MKYDVIIIGGGIIGSSIAWQLSRKEQKVLVVEKKDIASGSAGATDGVVGYHTKKPGKQMDLAKKSIEMYANLEEELGEKIDYVQGCGGMQLIEDEMQWGILSEIAAEQKKSGVDIEMISGDEARKIEPQIAKDIYGALYSPTSGKVNPIKLTMAYAKSAKKLGAEYLMETEVLGIMLENGKVKGVHTSNGDYFADIIVNAAGSWAAQIGKMVGLDLPIKPRKGQLAITEPVGKFMLATFQCARYNVIKFKPEVISDKRILEKGYSMSVEQTETGGMIIGSSREFVGYEEENTFEAIDMMMKRVARFFPAIRNVSVIRYFSGFRPYTPDGMPLIGAVKSVGGFYVAAGHEGDGIALSPITGLLMSELITTGKTSYPIEDFSPNRFLK